MREYKRPLLIFEEFIADQSVASGCTKKSKTVDTDAFNPQRVDCIISTYDYIFGSDNCKSKSGYDVVDSATLAWYDENNNGKRDDGEIYFIWKNHSSSGQPGDSATAKLAAICKIAGVDSNPKTNGGYTVHAGPVAVDTSSSTVYSFSY